MGFLRSERKRSPVSVKRYISFQLGGEVWGLPMEIVSGIEEVKSLTPIPTSDRSNLGVVLYRGRLVPLIDVRLRLGGQSFVQGDLPHLCVFLKSATTPLGFPIEKLGGILTGTENAAPPNLRLLDSKLPG